MADSPIATYTAEVIEVTSEKVEVKIDLNNTYGLQGVIDIDKCPALARVAGGAFYVDLYNDGTKEKPDYRMETRQVPAAEDEAFFESLGAWWNKIGEF